MTNTAAPGWTGRHAIALQAALRLSQEAFAQRLGVDPRTVAKWHQLPDRELRPATNGFLDTMLARADEGVQQRFAMLTREGPARTIRGDEDGPASANSVGAAFERDLSRDVHVGVALAWLDNAAAWKPGRARHSVAQELAGLEPNAIEDRGHLRARVPRSEIARVLTDYYGAGVDHYSPYRAMCEGDSLATSVISRPEWLDLRLPLGAGHEQIVYTAMSGPSLTLSEVGAQAAVRRLAESVATGARVVDAPLYRLASIEAGTELVGSVGLARFMEYALTFDLLEGELIDAISTQAPTSPGALPLRDEYLPSFASVIDTATRLCAGGVLALCAVARPKSRATRGAPDYLLLVQERSGRVLNAARRLAVIPKSFHEPLVDYRDDAAFFMTLEREMEEELFGRDDVDSALGAQRSADPMHLSRLSAPMRWLHDNPESDRWRMECTGFGFNLVSGNLECAALVVGDDGEWWGRFGGGIEANWESEGLRRYSSNDHDTVADLLRDPAWSNEGLFAMLQGLRRLSEIGGNRVDLPFIDFERSHGR